MTKNSKKKFKKSQQKKKKILTQKVNKSQYKMKYLIQIWTRDTKVNESQSEYLFFFIPHFFCYFFIFFFFFFQLFFIFFFFLLKKLIQGCFFFGTFLWISLAKISSCESFTSTFFGGNCSSWFINWRASFKSASSCSLRSLMSLRYSSCSRATALLLKRIRWQKRGNSYELSIFGGSGFITIGSGFFTIGSGFLAIGSAFCGSSRHRLTWFSISVTGNFLLQIGQSARVGS